MARYIFGVLSDIYVIHFIFRVEKEKSSLRNEYEELAAQLEQSERARVTACAEIS